MTANKTINIAKDFTEFPGGRYQKDGRGSGEEFRERFLLPRLREGIPLIVNLDGTSGYPSSFLEEAFGGLVRAGLEPEKLKTLLKLEASGAFQTYAQIAWNFISDAGRRENR